MDPLVSAYGALLGALTLHGGHRMVLLAAAWRHRSAAPTMPSLGEYLPFVTVQLPLYNERDVAGRLIDAAAALDWPANRLELQVLDDSTDDTLSCARGALARARARGLEVVVIHRGDRTGFKAGALANGLAQARGEFVAVFDADFTPQPDFLRLLIPHFADPEVGMVQARWGHQNAEASWLCAAQATMLDAHFRVEHLARNRSGAWFNFNGTAGIWRASAIPSAGGWQGDTLTEDLDLSYRAQMAGWRFVYRDDVVVPAELPDTVAAFASQQRRWAKGSIETLKKLGRRVIAAEAPLRVRYEALHHLTGNLMWPLALLVALLLPAAASEVRPELALLSLGAFLASTGSHAAYFGYGGRERSGWTVLSSMVLGLGLAARQSIATVEALLGQKSAFVRTPKHGNAVASYSAASSALPVELLLMGWQLVGIGLAVHGKNYAAVPFLALFAGGFGWVGWGLRPQAAVRAGATLVEPDEVRAK